MFYSSDHLITFTDSFQVKSLHLLHSPILALQNIYIYLYTYKSNSVNKENFVLKFGNRKHCL